MSYQQERRRLFAEVQAERDKMAAQNRREREEMERERSGAEAGQAAAMAALREEHRRTVEEAERRHTVREGGREGGGGLNEQIMDCTMLCSLSLSLSSMRWGRRQPLRSRPRRRTT